MLEIFNHIPQPNWFVALQFAEGYWPVKLRAKQALTRYGEYGFNGSTAGSGTGVVITADGTSGWETPTDANGNKQLEPQSSDYIYQIFLGISPSNGEVYLNYPQRQNRMSLITARDVPGKIGAWTGEISPYDNPSPETELWTVHDLIPYFNASNPGLSAKSQQIIGCWYLTEFSYDVIKDRNLALKLLKGDKRCSVKTMGDAELLIDAPNWLMKNYKDNLVKPEEVF